MPDNVILATFVAVEDYEALYFDGILEVQDHDIDILAHLRGKTVFIEDRLFVDSDQRYVDEHESFPQAFAELVAYAE